METSKSLKINIFVKFMLLFIQPRNIVPRIDDSVDVPVVKLTLMGSDPFKADSLPRIRFCVIILEYLKNFLKIL